MKNLELTLNRQNTSTKVDRLLTYWHSDLGIYALLFKNGNKKYLCAYIAVILLEICIGSSFLSHGRPNSKILLLMLSVAIAGIIAGQLLSKSLLKKRFKFKSRNGVGGVSIVEQIQTQRIRSELLELGATSQHFLRETIKFIEEKNKPSELLHRQSKVIVPGIVAAGSLIKLYFEKIPSFDTTSLISSLEAIFYTTLVAWLFVAYSLPFFDWTRNSEFRLKLILQKLLAESEQSH